MLLPSSRMKSRCHRAWRIPIDLAASKRGILAVPGPVHDGRAHAAVPSEELTVTFNFAFGRLVLASVLGACRLGRRLRYRFTDCEFDTDRRELLRAGEAVPVEPQVLSCWPISSATMRGW